ncbi:hypothetical protein BCR39DRAFT_547532 [Naematelia encephala]|uniref:Uncharacterized protein n=1 Tax=Naematelia encephala TaxID=71784 RepID=A0A1Y2ANZ1_9TREE|nr:hypothetical protein BCR39DRAFT_547532 [Naematelia encephala]
MTSAITTIQTRQQGFQPSPPRPSPPSTSTPSTSAKSPLSRDKPKLVWRPTGGGAVTGGVDGKVGRGKVTGVGQVGEEIERELSTLYVSNERNVGEMREIRERKIVGDMRDASERERKKSWGESLVKTAVDAGVLGAALGLTAYRLVTPKKVEETSKVSSESSRRSSSSSASRHSSRSSPPKSVLVDLLPPPAYEEYPRSIRGERDVEDTESWTDMNEEIITPSQSRASTQRGNHHSPGSHRHRRKRSRAKSTKLTSMKSMPSFEIHLDPQPPSSVISLSTSNDLPLSNDEFLDEGLGPTLCGGGNPEEDKGNDWGNEMGERLDAMSNTLRHLVEEGQKALEAECPVLSGGDWVEDEL